MSIKSFNICEKNLPTSLKMNRNYLKSLVVYLMSYQQTKYGNSLSVLRDHVMPYGGVGCDKRIFKYLIGTHSIGLWYPKCDTFDLVGYSGSGFAGSRLDRKSTLGTYQFLGHVLVSWHSKKQTSIALYTAEAEYIAAGSCVAQILCMKQ